MDYQAGHIYEFEVVKEFGDQEDFFRFRVPGAGEGRLPKLRFQRREALPDTLPCRVKYVNNGVPVLSHYMPRYVKRFYSQGAMHGREFDFKVLSVPSRPGDPYVLEDPYGMRFNLRDDNGSPLTEGQTVQCHFTKLTDTFFNIERCRAEMRLPFISAGDLLEKIGIRGALAGAVLRALSSEPALAEASEELSHSNPRWILTALQAAVDSLAQWFIDAGIRRHHRFFRAVLGVIRRCALYLIEDSRFLRNRPEGQRRELQSRITALVEALEPYTRTLKVFEAGGEVEFVEDIMNRLRESGYLYHPAHRFSVLMLILRTSPELVNEYLGRIFDTIMEWDLSTWTTEPFRSAFVGQFEIYIRHASEQLRRLPQAETEQEKDLLEKIVTAVALQTLIGGEDDPVRNRRNRSLLYRSIALLRPVAADTLLDKAFLTVNGVRMPIEYRYDHIRQPLMLMTRAMVPPAATDAPGTAASFTSGNVSVTVGPDGVSLRRTDEQTDTAAVPAGFFDWKLASPQVYLDNIQAPAASKMSNLEAHRRLWSDIETALFEQRTAAAPEVRERRKADTGDEVLIVIDPDEIEGGDNPVWRARIDDDGYLPASGTISRSDIVEFFLKGIDIDYNRKTAREAFIDDDGSPRHFVAKVTAVDTDGTYRFSMTEDIAGQRSEILDFNSTYHAVITQALAHEYRTISETGYGFYLQREHGVPAYPPGTVVEFRLLDISSPTHMVGTICDRAVTGIKVEKITAFKSLMDSICVAPTSIASPVAESVDLSDAADQTLDRDALREIIEIFRFKALSCSSILTAYDYLLFARMLALTAGDAAVADNLRLHASLLRLHQFYAANSRIDADELENYRAEVSGNPLLEMMFHRLETVSWLGKPEYCGQLWATANESRNNLENTLARLVLSYNMLLETEPDDSPVARGLKTKIAGLLGVNYERTNLKSYGRENQFVEFKSSIVYPARKSKTDKVEADPERQQRVILKIIASFMNSSGGTLYIGVNDASRCEAGLFDDKEYYKHRKARIGTHSFDMKTADNFCVFLENLVRDTWGSLVAGSVQIGMDEDATREVIVVEVKPRITPVRLDDKVYVRRSSSSVALTADEQAEFEAERGALEQQRREETRAAVTKTQAADVPPAVAVADTTPADAAAAPASGEARKTLATSGWRPNVLHSYEDGFTSPAGYIYMSDDDTVTYSSQDLYKDTEPGCRLALAFSADEAAGYLLLVYADYRVLKVPVAEIVEKGDNRPAPMRHDRPLLYADIVSPSQALLTVITDSRGNLYRRVTPVADISAGHLNGTPERLAEIPSTSNIEACETVDESAMPYFAQAMKSRLSARQAGQALKCSISAPHAIETIKSELTACAPH